MDKNIDQQRKRFWAKETIVASKHYNRWLVPPAALAVHLCIGMAYGFSVYWLPMSTLIGQQQPLFCPATLSFWQLLITDTCDWRIAQLGWIYTLFFIFLGCSAALWGSWLEKVGPRVVGVIATCCWCGGLLIASLGVFIHQLWLLWLGAGVIGGIGLGLGYISPVSTLLRWFPDKRGMAAGMAIMGFGGGAVIGAPLADFLMRYFSEGPTAGVGQSLLVLAAIYFCYMLIGSLSYRIPADSWRPAGQVKRTTYHGVQIDVSAAVRKRQFWLLWLVLCLNVSAGIGILGIASPLFQEVLGSNPAIKQIDIATLAAGFIGLLSLFNILGRFFWATLSDYLGRKLTFTLFFILGAVFYILIPWIVQVGNIPLFLIAFCIIISMYGGGFATIPAYLADIFGHKWVGAIHGRLLTAWSVAGITGPVLINYLREYQLASGLVGGQVYQMSLYLLAGLLVTGLISNLLVKPLKNSSQNDWVQSPEDTLQTESPESLPAEVATSPLQLTISWGIVLIPLLWGIYITIKQMLLLFI
jgi:MFS family permease